MAKKKDGTALFESISRSRDKKVASGMETPGWMGKAQPPSEAAGPVDAPAPSRPGRVPVSGSTVLLVSAGVVAVIAVAFYVGRNWNKPNTNAAANGATGDKVSNGGTVGTANVPNRTPAPTSKWYLVVQRMSSSRPVQDQQADAALVKAWLTRNGVPCTVSGSYARDGRLTSVCVRSLKGFDYIDKSKSPAASKDLTPEATSFAKEIEELGRKFLKGDSDEYRKCKEKYNFSQHRGNKLDPSYQRFMS